MSAGDIIRQIEILPADEQREVMQFVKELESRSASASVRRMDPVKAAAVADHVFEVNEELFRKLAQ